VEVDFAGRSVFEIYELVLTGGGQELAGNPGDARGKLAAEHGVSGPSEVDLIDAVQREEFPGEESAAFAQECGDFWVFI